MSRIRSVKPEFWTSQTVARCSRDARLVFIGLWNEADDAGRLVDSAKRLAGALFPFDDDVDARMVDGWLEELRRAGLIVRYMVDGARFLAIPSFREHQHPDKPKASKLPEPPETVPDASPTRPRRVPDASPGDWDWELDREKEREWEREAPAPSGQAAAAVAPKPTPAPVGEASPSEDPAWLQRAEERMRAPPRVGRLVRGRGVVGLAEQEVKPKTPEELLQRHPELRTRFGVFDGKGTRPKLEERLVALWDNWGQHYDERGPTVAMAKLTGWLAADAERFARGFARDVEAGQAGPAEDPRRRKLRERWRTRRGRGEDLPPFEEWAKRLEAESRTEAELRGEQAPAYEAPDVPLGELVRKAQAQHRARAGPGPGGGTAGSGVVVAASEDG